mgnify:CR=1 FL=1
MTEVTQHLTLPSEVLARKWRDTITDVWVAHHPDVPLLPQLGLTATDVTEAPFLADAKRMLAVLADQPGTLVRHGDEWLLDPKDVWHIASEIPSLSGATQHPIESEWGNLTIRRLRAVLHVTRLIQPRKGKLVPVQKRLASFKRLPAAQQFYVLWHADAYHIDWTRFAGLWEHYMRNVQEYLPVLWESIQLPLAGRVEDRAEWATSVLEAFTPLWDEEGLLDVRPGHTVALKIVQQHALPTIVDRFILRDLLERHGLVTLSEEFGMLSKFTWTTLGEKMLAAEASQSLSCGLDLLDK